MSRDPLLNLSDEDVITEVRLQLGERSAKLSQHVRIQREPMPVLAFPVDADAAANEINVPPAATDDLGASKTRSFHQRDGRTLRADGRDA